MGEGVHVHTDVPGRTKREAISLQKEKILRANQQTPMKVKTAVTGAAQASWASPCTVDVELAESAMGGGDGVRGWRGR